MCLILSEQLLGCGRLLSECVERNLSHWAQAEILPVLWLYGIVLSHRQGVVLVNLAVVLTTECALWVEFILL